MQRIYTLQPCYTLLQTSLPIPKSSRVNSFFIQLQGNYYSLGQYNNYIHTTATAQLTVHRETTYTNYVALAI